MRAQADVLRAVHGMVCSVYSSENELDDTIDAMIQDLEGAEM
jgi:hypothetical protein